MAKTFLPAFYVVIMTALLVVSNFLINMNWECLFIKLINNDSENELLEFSRF